MKKMKSHYLMVIGMQRKMMSEKIGLILIPCTECGYSQLTSEEVYWSNLEILCEGCHKYFVHNEKHPPIFVSRIYNPSPTAN